MLCSCGLLGCEYWCIDGYCLCLMFVQCDVYWVVVIGIVGVVVQVQFGGVIGLWFGCGQYLYYCFIWGVVVDLYQWQVYGGGEDVCDFYYCQVMVVVGCGVQ